MRSCRGQRRTESGTKPMRSLFPWTCVRRRPGRGGGRRGAFPGHLSGVLRLAASPVRTGRGKSAVRFSLKDFGVPGWCCFCTDGLGSRGVGSAPALALLAPRTPGASLRVGPAQLPRLRQDPGVGPAAGGPGGARPLRRLARLPRVRLRTGPGRAGA